MRFRAIAGAMLAPALAVSVASAQAPAPTGTAATCNDLTSVTFGSPSNSADKSQVTCTNFADGTQIALSAVARFGALNPTPPPVVETSPGTYLAQNGAGNPVAAGLAQWNFNYAITGYTAGDVFELLIDRNTGDATTFQSYILNPADLPASALGYQNSENEGFFNLPGDVFDPNADGTYTIEVAQLNTDKRIIDHASINIVVASPEPASVALFATGLVGLVPIARRRNRAAKNA